MLKCHTRCEVFSNSVIEGLPKAGARWEENPSMRTPDSPTTFSISETMGRKAARVERRHWSAVIGCKSRQTEFYKQKVAELFVKDDEGRLLHFLKKDLRYGPSRRKKAGAALIFISVDDLDS